MKVGILVPSKRRVRLLIVAACGLFLVLCAPALATSSLPAGVTLSVGYFDNEHGANPAPKDWSLTGASSASINFVGGPRTPPGPQGGWDSGGIRFDNSTAAPVTLDSVVVTIGSRQYNAANELWAPARLIIPAQGSLILASPTASTGLFDTSDYHCGGYPPTGVQDKIIPQIVVTQAGTPITYDDTTQVLTYDCTKPETRSWFVLSGGGAPPPPPPPSITSPASGSYNNTANVILTGSAKASSTVTVYDGSSLKGTTTASISGSWTKALTGVPDGPHSYTATATDGAGHASGLSSAIHVTVDTHAPPAPSVTGPANGSYSNTGDVTLTGGAEASSKITVYDGSTPRGTTTATASGNWTEALTGVPDGTHSYTATATDAASNTSLPSSAVHVTVDTHAPVTSITSGPGGPIRQTSASFGFSSSEASSTFQCRLAGPGSRPGRFSACSSPARFAHLAAGSYTFTVRATDLAGNADPSPPSRHFAVVGRSTSTQALILLALGRAKFKAAPGGPSATAAGGKIGTTVTFTLIRAGTARFTVETRLSGRSVHGRCVAESSHNRHSKVCARYRHVTGSFAWIGIAGSNHFHFTGRMDGRTLVPGRYRLLATATTGLGTGDTTPFRIRP